MNRYCSECSVPVLEVYDVDRTLVLIDRQTVIDGDIEIKTSASGISHFTRVSLGTGSYRLHNCKRSKVDQELGFHTPEQVESALEWARDLKPPARRIGKAYMTWLSLRVMARELMRLRGGDHM